VAKGKKFLKGGGTPTRRKKEQLKEKAPRSEKITGGKKKGGKKRVAVNRLKLPGKKEFGIKGVTCKKSTGRSPLLRRQLKVKIHRKANPPLQKRKNKNLRSTKNESKKAPK